MRNPLKEQKDISWSCRPPVKPDVFTETNPITSTIACDVQFMDQHPTEEDADGECTYGMDEIYIIVDSNDIEVAIICIPDTETITDTVTYINCDLDGDGEKDAIPLSGGNRS